MELSNDYYELWTCNDCYRVVAKTWYMASQLNNLLGYYPPGTTFRNDDEPVFKFSKIKLNAVMEVIKSSSF